MTGFLDRDLQKKLLEKLAEVYPQLLQFRQILGNERAANLVAKTISNLAYLEEHSLVDVNWAHLIDGSQPVSGKITAKGMDFLADDGGLTSILGVVTVKLHEDTIKDLMIAKIESSKAEPTVKKNLIDTLKKLPADGMKELSMAVLRQGIDSIPNAVEWFQKLLHLV